MVLFDVTYLCMNTPISDTLIIIKDYVKNDEPFTRKMAIPTELHPPKVWEQFVSDVYSILKCRQLESFFHCINNLHQ